MSTLALEANLFATIVSVLSGAIWLVILYRSRKAYAAFCAAGWFGLCIYWSLIAISAGPAPVMARAELALVVRFVLLASMAALGGGKLALMWHAWRLGRAADFT